MLKKIIFLLSIAISGCAITFSPEEISKAKIEDYGKYPENYDVIVRTYLIENNIMSKEKLENSEIQYLRNPKKYFEGNIYGYGISAFPPTPNKYAPGLICFFVIKNDKVIKYDSGWSGDAYEAASMSNYDKRINAIEEFLK